MLSEKKNQMTEFNRALDVALIHSAGNAELFAFYLTAPIAGWMAQGLLQERSAKAAISLLHQLHPTIKV